MERAFSRAINNEGDKVVSNTVATIYIFEVSGFDINHLSCGSLAKHHEKSEAFKNNVASSPHVMALTKT